MQLDLIDLRLFLQVAEAGSITHGARHAHLALAAASTRIRNLESLLGLPLLLREPRGVNLTPAGHTLAHHARAVFQQIENLRGEFEEHTGGFKGQVRIFSSTIALNEFLPQALSSFLIEYPGVNIDVEERPSNEIIRAVVEGVVHIGITAEPVSIAGLQTFPSRPIGWYSSRQKIIQLPGADALRLPRHLATISSASLKPVTFNSSFRIRQVDLV